MQDVFTAHEQIGQTLRCLTTIAEQSNEGIVVIDLDSNLLFVNEAWARMHGYETNDELIGKQFSIFHTEEQMKSDVIPLFEKIKHDGQIESTVEHIKSDGTVFPTQSKMILSEDETGNACGLIIIATDIRQYAILQEATADNLERVKNLSERITLFQKLLGECLEAGEGLAKQTGELQANNELLLQQMNETEQSPERPVEQNQDQNVHNEAQDTTTNQQPEYDNTERCETEEVSAENPEQMERPISSMKLPDPKELSQAAKSASSPSEAPDHNLQSKQEDNQEESVSRINQAISEEWMHAVQEYDGQQ
jgi:PAS domain S-box-containing protein